MCADSSTKTYGWIKPEVGGSPAVWGAKLNADLDAIDTQVATVASQVNSGIPDAPLDNNLYGRTNGNWTVIPPPTGVSEAPTTGKTFARNNAQWVPLPPELVDAPNNSIQYGRQSGNWTRIAAGVSEAPTDGQLYGRTNTTWVVVPTSGGSGGIADAPNDSTAYARKSKAWVNLTHTDISDWTATLAGYYQTSNPSGYQTASNVTASLAPYALASAVPAPSTTTPLADGTAAIGTSAAYARADHAHPAAASAPVKWTQLATANVTAVPNISFTGLSQIYGDLLIVMNNVKAAQSVFIFVSSNNGTSYSGNMALTSAGQPTSMTIMFNGYSSDVGWITATTIGGALPVSPYTETGTVISAISTHTGGCNALRFIPQSGNFTAGGSITIYGR